MSDDSEPADQVMGQSRRRRFYDTDEEARGRSVVTMGLGSELGRGLGRGAGHCKLTRREIRPAVAWPATNQDRWGIDSDRVNDPEILIVSLRRKKGFKRSLIL